MNPDEKQFFLSRVASKSKFLSVNTVARVVLVAILTVSLTGCWEGRDQQRKRQAIERKENIERLKAAGHARNPGAVEFNPKTSEQFRGKLTIEIQDSFTSTPEQVYWATEQSFDIHRASDKNRLIFRVGGDKLALN
jgi:hypothetical protein